MLSSRSFILWGLVFKVYVPKKKKKSLCPTRINCCKYVTSVCKNRFVCVWMFSYSRTICWKECSFSFELPLLIYEKQVEYICIDVFLGSVHCFIDLCMRSFTDPHYLLYINNSSIQILKTEFSESFAFSKWWVILCVAGAKHLVIHNSRFVCESVTGWD